MKLNHLTSIACAAMLFAGSASGALAQNTTVETDTTPTLNTEMNTTGAMTTDCPDVVTAPGTASGATNPATVAGSGAGTGDVVGTTTGTATGAVMDECGPPNGAVGTSGESN